MYASITPTTLRCHIPTFATQRTYCHSQLAILLPFSLGKKTSIDTSVFIIYFEDHIKCKKDFQTKIFHFFSNLTNQNHQARLFLDLISLLIYHILKIITSRTYVQWSLIIRLNFLLSYHHLMNSLTLPSYSPFATL